jgi:SET domain-containing protein
MQIKIDNFTKNSLLVITILFLLFLLIITIYLTHMSKNKYKYFNNKNYIGKSKIGGRGVFAGKCYKKDDIVEISPCIKDKIGAFNNSILKDYIFAYKNDYHILSFGYGSMYSHNDNPNLSYITSEETDGVYMTFIANRNINKDEELFISYGQTWWNSRDDRITKLD